ncbi:MAG: ArsR/SmtB family transcription factor [Candidatus Acidiferrum sp.]
MKAAVAPLDIALRSIADPARRRILSLLKQKGVCSIGKSTGLCACDVEGRLKLSQPTISHHMRVLTQAGLVLAEKHGQWMWYRRNEAALRALRAGLRKDL